MIIVKEWLGFDRSAPENLPREARLALGWIKSGAGQPSVSGRGSPPLPLSSQLPTGLSALAPAQRAGAQRLCALAHLDNLAPLAKVCFRSAPQQSASLFDHFVGGGEQIDGPPIDYVLRGNPNLAEGQSWTTRPAFVL